MKIIHTKIFSGKNIYSYKKCVRIDVDLCGYSEIPSKDIKDFNSNLLLFLPELKTHRCGINEDNGFVKRLQEGTYLAHICEHIILAIQNKLGIDVSYGKSREIANDIYYIIFEYEYKNTALAASRFAVDIINSLITNKKINFNNRIKLLKEILRNELIGPSTKAIIEAAKEYGIPSMELSDSGFYQLGYGKQSRIIEATIGSNTSCVATDIACDKLLTKKILLAQNIPVPLGDKVCNVIGLLKEAEKIGYPIVIKPRYGCKGKGVYLNINSEKELITKYNLLIKKYDDIIIEKYITGNDYRVCVVGYDVVAVSLRTPPYIVGDGIHTVKYLIHEMNKNPNRGLDHEKPLTKVKIDDELVCELKRKRIVLSTILKKNQKLFLRKNSNLSSGGVAYDCTHSICKENITYCIRAAKAVGLDICGIDIKAKDIGKPITNQGVIVEVNAAPGIRMHEFPTKGKKQEVADAIVNLQYNGIPKNIPIVSITGTNGKTTTARLISHILSMTGYNVGMTSTDGIFINGKCIEKGDDTGFYSARTVLLNKEVDAAVLETARGGLIRNGLAYDVADVGVVTNITNDHIGLDGINSIDDLAFVKSLVVEAVKSDGYSVINADDKYSKKIISRIKSKKIFFSRFYSNELIINLSKEDLGVFIKDDYIMIKENNKFRKLIKTSAIPITIEGLLEFNIENSLAAISALIGLGISDNNIIKGLKQFKLGTEYCKGRFNMFDVNGVKVILDYGHNIEGYKSVLKSIIKLKKHNLIGVIGMPGDRNNQSIESVGIMCSNVFDKIIIKEDKDKRGREIYEVANLLKQSILSNNYKKECSVCLDEVKALEEAIKLAQKDDIVIVFYEKIEPLIDLVSKLKLNHSNCTTQIASS